MRTQVQKLIDWSSRLTKSIFMICAWSFGLFTVAALADVLLMKRFGATWETVGTCALVSFISWVGVNFTAVVDDMVTKLRR